MWVLSQYLLGLMTTWLVEAPASAPYNGPLGLVYTGLFVAPTPNLTYASVLSAITEAAFNGYSRKEVIWMPAFSPLGGPYTLQGINQRFAPADADAPQLITGMFLADAPVGGNLLASYKPQGAGYPLNGPPNGLTVDVLIQLAYGSNYGAPFMYNA